jgi:hypothetical protein
MVLRMAWRGMAFGNFLASPRLTTAATLATIQ